MNKFWKKRSFWGALITIVALSTQVPAPLTPVLTTAVCAMVECDA